MGSVISLQIDSQLLPKNARFNYITDPTYGYWAVGAG